MINELMNITSAKFKFIDACTSVRKTIQLLDKGFDFFVVTEDNSILGVLSAKELLKSHPNRIAADALKSEYEIVPSALTVWEAYEKLEQKPETYLIVVDNGNNITGIADYSIIRFAISKYIDPLTGLFKSDFLYYQGIQSLKNHEEISVLFLDINEFGLINKKYGHINGNIILSEISSLLKQNTPPFSSWCRFGGDEFAMIASMQLEESMELAQKIVESISEHRFSIGVPISVSIGIASGRRNKNQQLNNYIKIINNLINKASLESTKAKKALTCYLSSCGCLDINEIA
ncbi:GGDEF domain-containing protein [Thermosyntropha sp.]|uniref:GGDEF domain-containing protein n=1 Tax=Thermosyntropha sp. TaxID=2740820 RepID=UPI0025E21F69|nr:GGDEF domain-containing protein [Thermosyntropha sp.]MBO8158630.1 GGDEF domain-containing protein [Thermosyntropha sp.]